MQDIKQNLADAVREARTKLGLSQEQLAEILGFDSRTILNIENGRGNPKFENLCALIRYLNLTDNKFSILTERSLAQIMKDSLLCWMIALNRNQKN